MNLNISERLDKNILLLIRNGLFHEILNSFSGYDKDLYDTNALMIEDMITIITNEKYFKIIVHNINYFIDAILTVKKLNSYSLSIQENLPSRGYFNDTETLYFKLKKFEKDENYGFRYSIKYHSIEDYKYKLGTVIYFDAYGKITKIKAIDLFNDLLFIKSESNVFDESFFDVFGEWFKVIESKLEKKYIGLAKTVTVKYYPNEFISKSMKKSMRKTAEKSVSEHMKSSVKKFITEPAIESITDDTGLTNISFYKNGNFKEIKSMVKDRLYGYYLRGNEGGDFIEEGYYHDNQRVGSWKINEKIHNYNPFFIFPVFMT